MTSLPSNMPIQPRQTTVSKDEKIVGWRCQATVIFFCLFGLFTFPQPASHNLLQVVGSSVEEVIGVVWRRNNPSSAKWQFQKKNKNKKNSIAFISEGLRSKLDVCCWYFSDSWIMFCCQTVLWLCWKYPDVSFTFGWVSTKIHTHKKKQLRNTADSTKSCYIWFKSVSGWIFSLSYWQCLDLWQPFFLNDMKMGWQSKS